MRQCEFLRYYDEAGKLISPSCIREDSSFRSQELLCVACLANLMLIELKNMHQHLAQLDRKFAEIKIGEEL